MNNLVFYCANCNKTFVGEEYQQSERPKCPNCGKATVSTGVSKEEWLCLTKEEREEKLNELTGRSAREAYANKIGVAYQENNDNSSSVLDSLYTDIGKKIKSWAKWIFIIEAVASVIGGIVIMANAGDVSGTVAIGFLTAVIGPIVAWVSSWLLYAFGELVDKTVENEKNTRNIAELMLENNLKQEQE